MEKIDRKLLAEMIMAGTKHTEDTKKKSIEMIEKTSDIDLLAFGLALQKLVETMKAPKCTDCNNPASKNKHYPNSEGGKYWTLCDTCFEKDNE